MTQDTNNEAASAPNGIPATLRHDAGAIARCSYCKRYSLDPATLSDRQPVCECGKQHGWSGSFVRPGADAKWSGKAPAAATASQSSTAGGTAGGDTCEDRCPECGHIDWRDFYTGSSKTHEVCASCNHRRPFCAPAVPEGVDTALPEPTIEGSVMHSELKICYRAPVHYTAEQMTTYGAQQREAGRREGIRHASKRISEEMAATRQTVSGMTDVQAWRIYEAAVEAVGRADTSREYAIKLVRAVESSLSATPPNKGSEDDKLFADNYRWLRDRGNSLETRQYDKGIANGPSCYHMVEGIRELKHGEELDAAIKAAIDTARAVPPAQGGQS